MESNEDRGSKRIHRASSLQKESLYADFYNKCSEFAKSDPTLHQNSKPEDHVVIAMGDEYEHNQDDLGKYVLKVFR